MMTVALALAASALFALGTVLQQRAAMREPEEGSLSAGFLLRLARRPVWLAGMAADGLGYVAQAAALGVGRIVVVQPILATTVIFSLPLGARLTGQRIGARKIKAAAVMTIGLAAFLTLGDPAGGRDGAPVGDWLIVGVVTAALCAPLVLGASGRGPETRAALLGTATGILWGLTAALTKTAVDELDESFVELITSWQPYALLLLGLAALTLSQASLQAGALAAAIATAAIFDPLTSLALGLTIFQEELDAGTLQIIGACIGLLVALASLYVLAAAQATDDGARDAAPYDAAGG